MNPKYEAIHDLSNQDAFRLANFLRACKREGSFEFALSENEEISAWSCIKVKKELFSIYGNNEAFKEYLNADHKLWSLYDKVFSMNLGSIYKGSDFYFANGNVDNLSVWDKICIHCLPEVYKYYIESVHGPIE